MTKTANMTKTIKPTINTQHHYITVSFGNGRCLTASHSGAKATGGIPAHVWKAWLHMIDTPCPKGKTMGTSIQEFADNIAKIWPEWDVAPREYAKGEKVVFNFGPRKGGVVAGVVEKKVRNNYHVRFENGVSASIPGDLLVQGGVTP